MTEKNFLEIWILTMKTWKINGISKDHKRVSGALLSVGSGLAGHGAGPGPAQLV